MGENESLSAESPQTETVETVDYSDYLEQVYSQEQINGEVAFNSFMVLSMILVINLAIFGALLASIFASSARGVR